MFKFVAMFFAMLTNFCKSADNLAVALEATTATVSDRANAFRDEQSVENEQRLAKLKARKEHIKANPQKFDF